MHGAKSPMCHRVPGFQRFPQGSGFLQVPRVPEGFWGFRRVPKVPRFQGSQVSQGSQTFRDFGNSKDIQHFIRFAICPRLPIPMFTKVYKIRRTYNFAMTSSHVLTSNCCKARFHGYGFSNLFQYWLTNFKFSCCVFDDLHFVGFHVCFIPMSAKSLTTLDLTTNLREVWEDDFSLCN